MTYFILRHLRIHSPAELQHFSIQFPQGSEPAEVMFALPLFLGNGIAETGLDLLYKVVPTHQRLFMFFKPYQRSALQEERNAG